MNKTVVYRLTTIDNPFDPFSQFEDWFAFDSNKHYDSCAYFDRIKSAMFNETKEFNEIELNNKVVDEIVSKNYLGIYKKVSKEIKTN